MSDRQQAAIVTIGSELVEGLRVDTNTAQIARDISPYGFAVCEAISVGDEVEQLATTLARLTTSYALVVVTGGLGPTHDDITRDATAKALGLAMEADPSLVATLEPSIVRHKDPRSAAQVLTQALVLATAEVLPPTTGSAAGQIIPTPAGRLVLLPGPPREMRPMLLQMLERYPRVRALPRELGVTGMAESDVQHAAQTALAEFEGIQLTVLARPGDVRVLLLDDGCGEATLDRAVKAVALEIGSACYSRDGSSLAETVIREAAARGLTVALAESCTGGMIASALTDVPGASEVFLGSVVAYSNEAKSKILRVDPEDLAEHGAVSRRVAESMAFGAYDRYGADICVSVTGLAGPAGGTPAKRVGTVWFGVLCAICEATATQTVAHFSGGDRESVRARATAHALNLIRHEVLKA